MRIVVTGATGNLGSAIVGRLTARPDTEVVGVVRRPPTSPRPPYDAVRWVAADLTRRFGLAKPRLAVAGLNPHAGEDGSMGTEDRDVIAPALAILRGEGIDARGPLPADTMFHARARAGYDVAICMYHDQALIPAKTLALTAPST